MSVNLAVLLAILAAMHVVSAIVIRSSYYGNRSSIAARFSTPTWKRVLYVCGGLVTLVCVAIYAFWIDTIKPTLRRSGGTL